MARKDKRNAKRKDNDENNDEQRRQEKEKEDERKRAQRKKKARRPNLADTPANLGLSNLYGEEEEGRDEAGSPSADATPSLGGLFEPRPSAEEDAILESSEKEDDDENSASDSSSNGDDNPILPSAEAHAEVAEEVVAAPNANDENEAMDVDPPVASIQDASAPTDAQAPPPSPAQRRAVRCTGQIRQGEVSVEPACMQLTRTQSDGSVPRVMRSVGIQAEYGRETLAKRWKRVLVTRERLAEKKRKRKAPALPTSEGTSSAASQAVPPPPTEVERPAFMQAKRPKLTTADKPVLSSTVVVPEGRGGTRHSSSRSASTSQRGKSRGPGGEAKKDQRVVVVLPPKSPAAQPPPPPREPRQRSRSPRDHSSRGRFASQNRSHQHQGGRNKSVSRPAHDAKKREEVKKDDDWRPRHHSQRRRSPSPRPSSSRHSSLPSRSTMSGLPDLSMGNNFAQIQWMAAALSTAFAASQQFQRQSDRRDNSPPPSSHRSRSLSRKGKGPGKGKGGGRGR